LAVHKSNLDVKGLKSEIEGHQWGETSVDWKVEDGKMKVVKCFAGQHRMALLKELAVNADKELEEGDIEEEEDWIDYKEMADPEAHWAYLEKSKATQCLWLVKFINLGKYDFVILQHILFLNSIVQVDSSIGCTA
jgi:hypothetical protein